MSTSRPAGIGLFSVLLVTYMWRLGEREWAKSGNIGETREDLAKEDSLSFTPLLLA